MDDDTQRAWATHLGVPAVNPDQLRRRLEEGDLASEFARVAGRMPHAPALTIGKDSRTHGELDRAAGAAAAWLTQIGVGPDSSVLLLAETSMEVVIAYLAALRLGSAVALADPSLTSNELQRMANVGEISWVLGSGPGLSRASQIDTPTMQGVVGLRKSDQAITSTVMDPLPDAKYAPRPLGSDRTAILAFTSGTTGEPKCAPLTHGNLLSSIRGVMWAWRWSPNEHLVHSLPISHQHGLGGIHATLLAGSRATILASFSPEHLLHTVKERQATALFAVPAIHERLLSEVPDLNALKKLRLLTSGSAPLADELARRVETATGQLPLERYGTTESGLNISNPIGRRIPGTVGLPLPGVEIALVADTSEVVAGEPGEILVRGPQVFSGYRGGDGGLERGWFHTGDIGVMDNATGYIAIVGRRKELIITGGMNVYPREVEEVLLAGPGVREVSLVGVPSVKWGEEVVAFVAPADVDLNKLSDHAAARLAPYKRPKRVFLVDALPRSQIGKVDKSELVKLASESV
ncbi:MAG TPA: class I adenylate-forming enzyme family protein [Acidimicrobiia bacterium]|nr:class I adenylate-forming enzyme family protein [Acidimicrobiia bacterium]